MLHAAKIAIAIALPLMLFVGICMCRSTPKSILYPISFSYPSMKWEGYMHLQTNQNRSIDFSETVPGWRYTFENEQDYMESYSRCKFAITMKKEGHDCLRHYEILAAGAVPFFVGIDKIPKKTMNSFPKSLIKRIMHLPGVPSEDMVVQAIKDNEIPSINHNIFDQSEYEKLRVTLMRICARTILTTHLYEHLVKTNPALRTHSKVAVWSHTTHDPHMDYQHVMVCIALIEAGHRVVVNVNIDFIFEDTDVDPSQMYGRGFTVCRCLHASLRTGYEFATDISAAAACDFLVATTLSNNHIPGDIVQVLRKIPSISIDGNDLGFQTPKTHASKHYLREFPEK